MKILLGTHQQIPDDFAAYSSGFWSHYKGLTWCYVVDSLGAHLTFDLYVWNSATEQKALLASFDDNDGTLLSRILDTGEGAPELLVEEIMGNWLVKTHRPPIHVREEMFARLSDWILYWRKRAANDSLMP
jgi:hypothetical protein